MYSLVLLLALALPVSPQSSSAPAVAVQPARYLQVHAPFAQQLILRTKSAHPELKKIGMHVVPPGETESCIIANAIPSKIGKTSSARDLLVVTTGEPAVSPHAEEGGFFDLGFPLFDRQHRPVGMLVMEIPYKDAPTRKRALSKGSSIRDEVAGQIPDKQALFGDAR